MSDVWNVISSLDHGLPLVRNSRSTLSSVAGLTSMMALAPTYMLSASETNTASFARASSALIVGALSAADEAFPHKAKARIATTKTLLINLEGRLFRSRTLYGSWLMFASRTPSIGAPDRAAAASDLSGRRSDGGGDFLSIGPQRAVRAWAESARGSRSRELTIPLTVCSSLSYSYR